MIITSRPLSSMSVRVIVLIRIIRVASMVITKDSLQAKAEAIDLIVPLVPVLMTMVHGKQLHFTQKLSQLSSTEARLLWLVRSLCACQVGGCDCPHNPESRDCDGCLALMSAMSRTGKGLYTTHVMAAQ